MIKKKKQEQTPIVKIEPNYDGIAKVLNAFTNLYKVANDKGLVDKVLEVTVIKSISVIEDKK